MLSKTDNELLTRVGPGTLMGGLLRQYWQPVLLTWELAEPDGAPVRVRLLGEDLIAFRDTSGRPGLIANACPHRGASLFFGRNEEDGLRCVYHGWKFDVTGACIDMPNEPVESNFKHKIQATAYPCREQGGIIWAYLGPAGQEPGLPELEWTTVPENQRYVTKRYHECDWAQALEGDIDSSHVGFLHSALENGKRTVPITVTGQGRERGNYITEDSQPRFETLETDYGVLIGARRNAGEDSYYWRVTTFVMPFYAITPPTGDTPVHVNVWTPVDDTHTLVWSVDFHGARPLTEREVKDLESGRAAHAPIDGFLPATSAPAGRWRTMANGDNDFMVDRQAQRTSSFTGLEGFWRQDRGIIESMGPVMDRTKEHLGWSDTAVIQVRRVLLRAARALQQGQRPPGLDPSSQRVRSAAMVLPRETPWIEQARTLAAVRPGVWTTAP